MLLRSILSELGAACSIILTGPQLANVGKLCFCCSSTQHCNLRGAESRSAKSMAASIATSGCNDPAVAVKDAAEAASGSSLR